jgi:carboxylesterase
VFASAFILVTAVGVMLLRWFLSVRAERASLRRLPLGADGIIRGAEGIVRHGRASRGVLLLHGFGDTPQTLMYLADRLHESGFDVHAPLLPGHGRTLREFSRGRAEAWLAGAEDAYAELRGQHRSVGLVGVSMGGALALLLSARVAPPDALVLIAPYLTMRPRARQIAAAHRLVTPFVRYLATREEASIRDDVERASNRGFGTTTPRLLNELRSIVDRAATTLGSVRSPTLMIQSLHDNRIDRRAAEAAFAALGAPEKKLVWVETGGHVITVDTGRERVLALTAEWLAMRVGRLDPAGGSVFSHEGEVSRSD